MRSTFAAHEQNNTPEICATLILRVLRQVSTPGHSDVTSSPSAPPTRMKETTCAGARTGRQTRTAHASDRSPAPCPAPHLEAALPRTRILQWRRFSFIQSAHTRLDIRNTPRYMSHGRSCLQITDRSYNVRQGPRIPDSKGPSIMQFLAASDITRLLQRLRYMQMGS
jgi:hypothetical protein